MKKARKQPSKRTSRAARPKAPRGKRPRPPVFDAEEALARHQRETDRRHKELLAHLNAHAELHAPMARALGLEAEKLPAELRRELEAATERMLKAQAQPPREE